MESQSPQDLCERTFVFAVNITKLCRQLDRQPGVSRTLARQLLRSGTSNGANYEESQSAESRLDFICKVSIALKEARQTCYWLRLLQAGGVVSDEGARSLIAEANQLKRILGAIVSRAKGTRKPQGPGPSA